MTVRATFISEVYDDFDPDKRELEMLKSMLAVGYQAIAKMVNEKCCTRGESFAFEKMEILDEEVMKRDNPDDDPADCGGRSGDHLAGAEPEVGQEAGERHEDDL